MIVLLLLSLVCCVVFASALSCIPLDGATVYDPCNAAYLVNATELLSEIGSYLSTNGTSEGGVASLLNVAEVIGAALSYSGMVLPLLQPVTVVEALTVEALVSTNSSVPPYLVDLSQLTAAANFPLDPTTHLPLLTQPYAATYITDWDSLLAQLATISGTLTTISTKLQLGLTTQVPVEVSNNGSSAGREYYTVQLSDLVYTALFQPSVVLSDYDANINIIASQPIVSAFITPYLDPPSIGSAGTLLCATNFAGATNAPGWPYASSYSGNDQVIGGSLGSQYNNPVTGLSYESVSTCAYGTTFGTPVSHTSKTTYPLNYGGNQYTAATNIVWPECFSSTSCPGF